MVCYSSVATEINLKLGLKTYSSLRANTSLYMASAWVYLPVSAYRYASLSLIMERFLFLRTSVDLARASSWGRLLMT